MDNDDAIEITVLDEHSTTAAYRRVHHLTLFNLPGITQSHVVSVDCLPRLETPTYAACTRPPQHRAQETNAIPSLGRAQ